jgi:hypothetical protein
MVAAQGFSELTLLCHRRDRRMTGWPGKLQYGFCEDFQGFDGKRFLLRNARLPNNPGPAEINFLPLDPS